MKKAEFKIINYSKNIVWLASYPKSGNTWFRVFLSNLRFEKEDEAEINSLHSTSIASCRNMFEESLAVESSDLTNDEIDLLRPEFYKTLFFSICSSKIHCCLLSFTISCLLSRTVLFEILFFTSFLF